METKIARAETHIKQLDKRLTDYKDENMALRSSWNSVTIYLASLIFGVIGLIFGGLYWVDNKQDAKFNHVMSEITRSNDKVNAEMKQQSAEIIRISHSISTISKDHDKFKP